MKNMRIIWHKIFSATAEFRCQQGTRRKDLSWNPKPGHSWLAGLARVRDIWTLGFFP